MATRRRTPPDTETEVLIRSGRRCALCHGLDGDLGIKTGQIGHVDRNPANSAFDNLVFLCLEHHNSYDSVSRQAKGITPQELKTYRDKLYDGIDAGREEKRAIPLTAPSADVPCLQFSSDLDPSPAIPYQGIRLTDKDPSSLVHPSLIVDFRFKKSRYFGQIPIDDNEKWVYVEANVRPALNLRIQVRAWNQRDTEGLMQALGPGGKGYDLHGPTPQGNDEHPGDYLLVWEEANEKRMLVSTFTATKAGISAHARLAQTQAAALADYLKRMGFLSSWPLHGA